MLRRQQFFHFDLQSFGSGFPIPATVHSGEKIGAVDTFPESHVNLVAQEGCEGRLVWQ
jgi:hypothetical protein